MTGTDDSSSTLPDVELSTSSGSVTSPKRRSNELDREERMRRLRQKEDAERQRRLAEIEKQELAVRKFRERQEADRLSKLAAAREREKQHLARMSERRQQLEYAQQERIRELAKRSDSRLARPASAVSNGPSKYAFGSCTPRGLDISQACGRGADKRCDSVMTTSTSSLMSAPRTSRTHLSTSQSTHDVQSMVRSAIFASDAQASRMNNRRLRTDIFPTLASAKRQNQRSMSGSMIHLAAKPSQPPTSRPHPIDEEASSEMTMTRSMIQLSKHGGTDNAKVPRKPSLPTYKPKLKRQDGQIMSKSTVSPPTSPTNDTVTKSKPVSVVKARNFSTSVNSRLKPRPLSITGGESISVSAKAAKSPSAFSKSTSIANGSPKLEQTPIEAKPTCGPRTYSRDSLRSTSSTSTTTSSASSSTNSASSSGSSRKRTKKRRPTQVINITSSSESPVPPPNQEELDAKARIAAKRKEMKERKEREAELEQQRQAEAERRDAEETARRLAEAESLARLAEEAEEKRLQAAIEEKRKRDADEEAKRNEEELAKKAREEKMREAERRQQELEAHLKAEEAEREARKLRLQAIMSRTRGSNANSVPNCTSPDLQQEGKTNPDETVENNDQDQADSGIQTGSVESETCGIVSDAPLSTIVPNGGDPALLDLNKNETVTSCLDKRKDGELLTAEWN